MSGLWNEITEIKSTKKKLREFAVTLGIFFLLVGGFWAWHHPSRVGAALALAAFFFVTGFWTPSVLVPVQKVWMGVALVMGWVMSRVILSVLFYGVLTPISLYLRWTGKDLLQRKWKEKKDTFWVNHVINDAGSNYEKQY